MVRVVVVGCGHLGTYFAERAAVEGMTVTVIDQEEAALSALQGVSNTSRFIGDAIASDVMDRAMVHRADVLIAATPKDELNVAIGVVARTLYQVKHAIARVRDPKRVDSFRQLGLETLCPTTLEAKWITDRLSAREHSERLRIHIVGYGELGAYVARALSRAGHQVVVVDRDRISPEHLEPEFPGQRVHGDATDPCVLERSHTAEADLLVVATRDDVVNLSVALAAKQILGVRDIVARVRDPRREPHFRGVATLSSTVLSANAALAFVGRLGFTGSPRSYP